MFGGGTLPLKTCIYLDQNSIIYRVHSQSVPWKGELILLFPVTII